MKKKSSGAEEITNKKQYMEFDTTKSSMKNKEYDKPQGSFHGYEQLKLK
jgi:hypothetical protein